MENRRIIFMGTPQIASVVLKTMLENDIHVGLVVTQPDKKKGRKQQLVYSEVKEVALEYDIPVFEQVKALYNSIHELTENGTIVSAYVCDANGFVPALCKMAFGNKLGFALNSDLKEESLFAPAYGCIVAEVAKDKLDNIKTAYTKLGEVKEKAAFTYKEVSINVEEALSVWEDKLEKVFPTKASKETTSIETKLFNAENAKGSESINYTFKDKYATALKTVVASALNKRDGSSLKPADVTEYMVIDYIQTLNHDQVEGAQAAQELEGRYSAFRYFVENVRTEIKKEGLSGDYVYVQGTAADNSV